MKLLITYSSKTGNTKKLAEGIHKYMELSNCDIKPISEVETLDDYDTILVGYWVDKGGPNTEAAEFLKTITGKRVGIFATLGAYPDTQHGWDSLVNGENLIKENNEVIGKYICQGKLSEKIISFFKTLEPGNPHAITPAKLKRYEIAAQHPNEAEMKSAAILFKERL